MSTALWFAKESGICQCRMTNCAQDNWIKKIGFPVVTVIEEPGQITVRQHRFLSSGDVKPEEDETTWWIPLSLKSGETPAITAAALTSKVQTLKGVDESFYKLNTDNNGFFRTNYPPGRLAKLSASKSQLSIEDKIGLIGDAAALAVAGHGTTAGFLAFVEGLKAEDNYLYVFKIDSPTRRSNRHIGFGHKSSPPLRMSARFSPGTKRLQVALRSSPYSLSHQLQRRSAGTSPMAKIF
jgi:ERAP1-like C-terminal domain